MEITIKLNPEEKGDRNLLAVILAEIVGSTQPKVQAISSDTVMATEQPNPQTKSEQFETVASRTQTTAPAKPKRAGRTTKPAPQAEPNTPVPAPEPAPEPVKVESSVSEPVKVVTSDAPVVTVSEQPQQARQDLPEQPQQARQDLPEQTETKTDVTYDDIRNIIKAFVLEADATFVRQVLEYELDVTSARNLKPEEYGKAYAVLEKALKNFREHNKEQ